MPSDIADVILEGEVQVVEQLATKPKSISRSLPFVKTWCTAERRGVGRRRCHFRYRPAARGCHLFREDGTACRRLHKEPGFKHPTKHTKPVTGDVKKEKHDSGDRMMITLRKLPLAVAVERA